MSRVSRCWPDLTRAGRSVLARQRATPARQLCRSRDVRRPGRAVAGPAAVGQDQRPAPPRRLPTAEPGRHPSGAGEHPWLSRPMRPSPAQRRLVRLAGVGAVAAQPDTDVRPQRQRGPREEANGAVTESEHCPADSLAYVKEPSDGPGAPERVTTYDYDNVGNLLQGTEPKGAPDRRPGRLRHQVLLRRAQPGARGEGRRSSGAHALGRRGRLVRMHQAGTVARDDAPRAAGRKCGRHFTGRP